MILILLYIAISFLSVFPVTYILSKIGGDELKQEIIFYSILWPIGIVVFILYGFYKIYDILITLSMKIRE